MILFPFALALCITGFAALAAAMPRHWRQLGSARRPSPRALRSIALFAFFGALVLCGTIWNPARAVPIGLGLASVAAIAVGLILSFAPQALLRIALLLPLLTGAAALWR